MNITKEKLIEILSQVFDEGLCGYKDLKESYISNIIESLEDSVPPWAIVSSQPRMPLPPIDNAFSQHLPNRSAPRFSSFEPLQNNPSNIPIYGTPVVQTALDDLTNTLSAEIAAEIDREIIADLRTASGNRSSIYTQQWGQSGPYPALERDAPFDWSRNDWSTNVPSIVNSNIDGTVSLYSGADIVATSITPELPPIQIGDSINLQYTLTYN